MAGRTNDEARDLILRFLYDRHQKARGVKSQEILLRDLQSEMKRLHGFSQQEVASNLDYLVQKGWVQRVVTPRPYRTGQGTMQSGDRITYKISAEGIDRIEGESEFRRVDPFAGIRIENVGGVTVVGDRNVVRTQFAAVAEELEELRRAVNASDLADEGKLAVTTEIQTIELQLRRPQPDSGVIQRSWEAIKAVATVGTLADLVTRAGVALAPFIGAAVTS
jgi:hypothetical protein